MRSNEFIGDSLIAEIDRIPQSAYRGGKEHLQTRSVPKQFKKLPGGSGLLYTLEDLQYTPAVKLWDPNTKVSSEPKPVRSRFEFRGEYERRLASWQDRQDNPQKALPQLIGKLTLESASFPLKGALQVETITVDEDYRGVGIAKALYGIVLTIMKRPLLAGYSQTPGGRRNWVSLSQIPGVHMKGYVALRDEDIAPNVYDDDGYDSADKKRANKNIDTIMSKLGGEYLGEAGSWTPLHYFAFDVKPNTSGQELEAYVNTNLSRVYGNNYRMTNGLYAVWTGQ